MDILTNRLPVLGSLTTEIKELKPQKVTFWFALSATQIFGSVFIKKNITGDHYRSPSFVVVQKKKQNGGFLVYARWICAHCTKPIFFLLNILATYTEKNSSSNFTDLFHESRVQAIREQCVAQFLKLLADNAGITKKFCNF